MLHILKLLTYSNRQKQLLNIRELLLQYQM